MTPCMYSMYNIAVIVIMVKKKHRFIAQVVNVVTVGTNDQSIRKWNVLGSSSLGVGL